MSIGSFVVSLRVFLIDNVFSVCFTCILRWFFSSNKYYYSKIYRIFTNRSRGYYFSFSNVLCGFYSRAASIFLSVYVLKLVSSEHSSQSTINDKKTETLNKLQFYCLFCETLVCHHMLPYPQSNCCNSCPVCVKHYTKPNEGSVNCK